MATEEERCAAALHHRDSFYELNFEELDHVELPTHEDVRVPVVKGHIDMVPHDAQEFIASYVKLCQPRGIFLCDGSPEEEAEIREKLVARGLLKKLEKMDNCYVCRTDPADVARVESKTFITTKDKYESVPHVKEGITGILGRWKEPKEMDEAMEERFKDCMKGRVMYVIPFSMGPIGSPLSKIGVQLTDFNYVVLSMYVMTRVSSKVWDVLGDGEFVKCVHSIGAPRPLKQPAVNHWPCNPDKVLIGHYPDERLIMSYGSGYGGNSLLGKKCFALRIASRIAKDEGWMAEHMLITGITLPNGKEKFMAAAFPSQCGKTNMAMLTPTIPGFKVRCVGDDIAWMRFDENGVLHGINPEAGFFGVAPGTNIKTNPIAMQTVQKDTIFTNVAMTDDGGVYWEGLEKEVKQDTEITDWHGGHETIKEAKEQHIDAAHPNSRFCCPACECPIIHSKWEDPKGVPIDAIIFGGRRPTGVPLVFESHTWEHGVMLGAALKSETTSAAEFKGKTVMHDPMAMRPFLGYNFGRYLDHWLSLKKEGRKMPRIFHVNWFRLDENGKFLWPGFGDNIRVLDWIARRCEGEDIAEDSPIGLIPKKGTINMDGLDCDWDQLFSLPKDYWVEDVAETKRFFDDQVGCDLPDVITKELNAEEERIKKM